MSKKRKQFVPVPGYNDKISVNRDGEVWVHNKPVVFTCRHCGEDNLWRTIKGWKIKPELNSHGYHQLSLTTKGKRQRIYVHRIVALTFLHKPHGKDYVNHKNSNRIDNRVENLEWCTPKENVHHAIRNGRMNKPGQHRLRGEAHGMSKLKEKDVKEIRQLFNDGIPRKEIYQKFRNVSKDMIGRIINNKNWKHI